MPPVDLSILIVSWNVKDFVLECIGSVERQTEHLNYEIILMDNASNDQTADTVRQKFRWVKIIQNEENLGFAAANNRGLALACGRFVLFLNPDTKIIENSFRKIVDYLESHVEVGALGCMMVNGDGAIDYQCAKNMPTITNLVFEPYITKVFPKRLKSFVMRDWHHLNSREVELLSGACLVVRREVFEKVGPLDETMFMYGEDVEFCYRVRKAGWKLFYYADTKIIHYGGQSTKQNQYAMQAANVRSLRRFFSKHRSRLYGYTFEFLLVLEYAAKYVCLLLIRGWRQKYRREDIQQYRNVVLQLLRTP